MKKEVTVLVASLSFSGQYHRPFLAHLRVRELMVIRKTSLKYIKQVVYAVQLRLFLVSLVSDRFHD